MPAVARGHELVRPASSLATTGPLSPAQVDAFFRDGYIVARGLVPPPLLARAQAACGDKPAAPAGRLYDALDFSLSGANAVFRELAVASPIAAAAAQLTGAGGEGGARERALCVVKDAFFKMRGGNQGCNFHVDDAFFWPCPLDAVGPGVNVWVALDAVGADGGGLAVVPGSHTADWLDCRDAIRDSTASQPLTCRIHELHPQGAERLERASVTPHMQPGDAILHTRFLFHRGDPFVPGSQGESGPGVGRFTVRYMPGDAVVQPCTVGSGRLKFETPFILREGDPVKYPAVDLDAALGSCSQTSAAHW